MITASGILASVTLSGPPCRIRSKPAAGSNSAGLFRFVELSSGTYTLTVKARGFKTHTIKAINLSASETRDVGEISLEVGGTTETVSVTAQATPV